MRVASSAWARRQVAIVASRLRAEGRAIGRGRRIMSAEARVFDADRRILAHGTSTIMVLSSGETPPIAS